MTGLECVALAVYLESRGEPAAGQLAVASVVWNRTENHKWPKEPCEVVKQKKQFAFLSKSKTEAFLKDPNRFISIAESARVRRTTHATYFMRHDAAWRPKNRKLIMKIGDHLFYD